MGRSDWCSMTDACIICETEAICLDDWYVQFELVHGLVAIIECVCPWCVKEYIQIRKLVKK